MPVNVGILTISDRSSSGERPDIAGPLLQKIVNVQGWSVAASAIVPDEIELIKSTLFNWAIDLKVDLILTTGGTGFAPRDVTPEATLQVITRETPGLSETIRLQGMKTNIHAILSRGVAGIYKNTLIVNLPGNPNGAVESFEVILPVLPHAIQLIQNTPTAETGHHVSG